MHSHQHMGDIFALLPEGVQVLRVDQVGDARFLCFRASLHVLVLVFVEDDLAHGIVINDWFSWSLGQVL